MKTIIFSLAILFLLGQTANAQQVVSFPQFIKSVQRTMAYGNNSPSDSCFIELAILIIDVDSTTKAGSVSWSDNTSSWIKELFEKEKNRLKIEELQDYAAQHGFQNDFLFPIIIRKSTAKCSSDDAHTTIGKNLFFYQGKPLTGMVFFPIEGIYY